MEDFSRLAPLALVVMLVDLLESTSIARALAAKGKYELNANQVRGLHAQNPLRVPCTLCLMKCGLNGLDDMIWMGNMLMLMTVVK
jgi:hypothetical protein